MIHVTQLQYIKETIFPLTYPSFYLQNKLTNFYCKNEAWVSPPYGCMMQRSLWYCAERLVALDKRKTTDFSLWCP